MSDSEQSFLDVAITEVLPELQAANKNILEEHLQSIGVETYDDLRFVTETDLMTALRPIQARKLLSVWKQKCKYKHHTTHNYLKSKADNGIYCTLNHNGVFWGCFFCHLKTKLQRTARNHLWMPHLSSRCHHSLFHPEVHRQPPPEAQDLTHSGKTTLKFHGVNFLRK